MFSWTEVGARHNGIVQSLLVTCRLHDVNLYDYLVDVFSASINILPCWSNNTPRARARPCSHAIRCAPTCTNGSRLNNVDQLPLTGQRHHRPPSLRCR